MRTAQMWRNMCMAVDLWDGTSDEDDAWSWDEGHEVAAPFGEAHTTASLGGGLPERLVYLNILPGCQLLWLL